MSPLPTEPTRAMYFDVDSNPISRERWGELWMARRDEGATWWRIGRDKVGDVEVSTVWLGLDHSLGDGPPLIFETMVLGGDEDESWRYSTLEQAREGHARVVEQHRV